MGNFHGVIFRWGMFIRGQIIQEMFGGNVRIHTQDYKSLCAAVVIFDTLVNTQTDSLSPAILLAQPPEIKINEKYF